MQGRALIDLPDYGLKCGEFGDLPKTAAAACIKAGHFDPKAEQQPDDPEATGGDGGLMLAPDGDQSADQGSTEMVVE